MHKESGFACACVCDVSVHSESISALLELIK